jgi:hypothetical protein
MDFCIVDLELNSEGILSFVLNDMQGKTIAFLLETKGSSGMNRFSFRTSDLPSGMYLLQINKDGQPWRTEQVVKQ